MPRRHALTRTRLHISPFTANFSGWCSSPYFIPRNVSGNYRISADDRVFFDCPARADIYVGTNPDTVTYMYRATHWRAVAEPKIAIRLSRLSIKPDIVRNAAVRTDRNVIVQACLDCGEASNITVRTYYNFAFAVEFNSGSIESKIMMQIKSSAITHIY